MDRLPLLIFLMSFAIIESAVVVPILLAQPRSVLGRIGYGITLLFFFAGAGLTMFLMMNDGRMLSLLIGLFFTSALCLPPLLITALRLRKNKLYEAGRCQHCAYDLRGCPDARHCPECGVVIYGFSSSN